MKTYLQLLSFLLISGFVFAQDSFSDDFESYMVGDYVGQQSAQWTTWSGTTGGAEDARVTDAQANSGNHSIFFQGGSGGGPQDVVLPFGGKREQGGFQYEMAMYVPVGNNAYFNFQGETTIGQTWVMNAQFRANGNLEIDDSGSVRLASVYPQGEWFTIGFDINLTSNLWQVSINGECIGSFDNPNNYLASIDLFPVDANSVFYVDDVSYNYDAQAEDLSFEIDASIAAGGDGSYGITGEEKRLTAVVANQGTMMINGFSVELESGSGTSMQDFSGETLAPGESTTISLDEGVMLNNGPNSVKLSLVSINGEDTDENTCNNSQQFVLQGFTPAPDKKVFIEEGTGTWCQWCPRGDVYMNLMTERYPDRFVGVAVHNNDPMMVGAWNAGLTSTPGFTGFPGAVVGRETVVDPSGIEAPFVTRVQSTAFTYLRHGASYNEATRELTVEVTTHFNFALSGDLRLFVALTEDGVTGTTSGYAQANAYAGGNNGEMGGYELLPTPVPASQMVYNHVGRYLFTAHGGMLGAYDGQNITSGSEVVHSFTYTLPTNFDHENMHIVSAFITPTGAVDNAESTTIEEAVENGISSTVDVVLDSGIEVYPNPFSDYTNIRMNFEAPEQVRMEVTDAMGRLIASRNYGTIQGDQVFTFDGSSLQSGIYYLKLYSGDRFTTKRVVINH